MLISDKHKFIFIHIPKTAGSSIKNNILPYCNDGQLKISGENFTDLNGYHPHVTISPKQVDVYKDYYKFACVRNPFQRYVSMWKFFKKRKPQEFNNINFEKFIDDIVHIKNKINSKLQYTYIYNNNNTLLVDKIIKFENLQGDFSSVCNSINIPTSQLPHLKNSGNYDYMEYYNSEMLDKLRLFCKKDLDLFGYNI